jgi:hypothetical protein
MSQFPNDPELTAIESALGRLIPAPSRLDRDRLMFQAGAVSKRGSGRSGWAWPSAAAALAAVVVCESMLLAMRPAPRVVERLVVVREPPGPSTSESVAPAPSREPASGRGNPPTAPVVRLSPASGLAIDSPATTLAWAGDAVSNSRRLKDLVLKFGLDALPEPASRLSEPGARLDPLETGPVSAGALRRIELEKLLNPNPGDRS